MDGHIGRLNCRYHLLDARSAPVTARLDRIARETLPAMLSEALDRKLGDDPSVYVVRSVTSTAFFDADATVGDSTVSRQWAEQLASDLVQEVHSPGSRSNVVRFADPADYAASFVTDLLRGESWDTWYYSAFEYLREQPLADAVRSVFRDCGPRLPAFLANLNRRGVLERVLGMLDRMQLDELWSDVSHSDLILPSNALRPLFFLAISLADDLELWAGSRPGIENLFASYLASGPFAADWRDRSGLAVAVLEAVRFLLRTRVIAGERLDSPAFAERLRQALARVDWLDVETLASAVRETLCQREPELALESGVPEHISHLTSHAPGFAVTPRQKHLLADLCSAFLIEQPRLAALRSDPRAQSLLLYASLLNRFPRWAGDPLAPAFIERLLAALFDTRLRLRRGESPPSLGSQAVQALRELGEPGRALAAALLGEITAPERRVGVGQASGCAGIFLLIRALFDVRLPSLIEAADWRPLPAVLLSLGLRWQGQPGPDSPPVDPGLLIFAGIGGIVPGDLRQLWASIEPAQFTRFQAALLATLAGQRVLDSSELHILEIPVGNSTALVAGSKNGNIWPLSQVLNDGATREEIVESWRRLWIESTGVEPVITEAKTGQEVDALLASLSAVDAGQVGVPGADLCLALTAISLMRAWSRWLRLPNLSVGWLLDHCVRRPGIIYVDSQSITVELQPRATDFALDAAGYTAALESVPWLRYRRISFTKPEV